MFVFLSAVLWTAADPPRCGAVVTRADVVPCALAVSDALRAERAAVDAASAQRSGATPVLPANPVLDLSIAHRGATRSADRAINWYAALRQEIEIAGQRGQRIDEAEAALGVAQSHALISERDVAAEAWERYFDALAAEREVSLAKELAESTALVAKAARASAEQGIGSALDADVAHAAHLRVQRLLFAAGRRRFSALATLASLLHLETPEPRVEGDLLPLHAVVVAGAAIDIPPEVRQFNLEQQQFLSRASLYRRLRAPNPSLSLFAQNDGFDERVFGVGLSFPIPLPQPVGRTHAGEIAEATAQAERAAANAARAARVHALQVAVASDTFRSRQSERDAFDSNVVQRAHEQLRALALEVGAGRLPFREAAVAQQALVDLLASHLDAELQLCLASVRLARVTRASLDEVAR